MSEPARYEIIEPAFRALVLGNALLETLVSHARWLEGPVWFADHEVLLVSDIPNDRILRWSAAGGVSVFRQPAGFPNGHTRDREGRLVGCSHLHRCVTRTELDGTVTMLADRFEGRRLCSPNDVVVSRDGSIWFTDPPYGIQTDYEGEKQEAELPPAVYWLDPGTRELRRVADDFEGPNGLCFSPDEHVLYVTESGEQFSAAPRRFIRAFDVDAAGTLSNSRIFHTVTPGYADGIRCDTDGNLWCGAADGVHCISPAGALLGKILTPAPVSNLTFGGRLRSHLFLCAGQQLLAIAVNARGCQWP